MQGNKRDDVNHEGDVSRAFLNDEIDAILLAPHVGPLCVNEIFTISCYDCCTPLAISIVDVCSNINYLTNDGRGS